MATQRQMNLTVFMLAPGYHFDSWRMPGSRAEELGHFELVRDLTLKAESAKIDAVFFGDVVALGPRPGTIDVRTSGFNEPITTLSALSAVTKNIGLVGTMSTTYGDPYVTARLLNGLDNISGGRAGWNVVTTSGGGFENFGLDAHPAPEDRYRRAHEFVKIAQELWDSWSDDAVVTDRENGVWADIDKIRPINHEGEHFKVMGPLNMRRSPQGRPVLFQAGSSGPGSELGAAIADGIYTAQPRKAESIEFRAEFRRKIAANGRDPEQVKILPGIMPILGKTMAEAQELADELASYVHLEQGRNRISMRFGLDLSGVDWDDPIPSEVWDAGTDRTSRFQIMRRKPEEGFTLREFIVEQARAEGHHWMIGTPEDVADRMIDWFDAGACDGFNLNPAFMPGGMDLLCDLLVPVLQERGYAKSEYVGSTLRENLGLQRPGAWDTRS